MQVVTTSSFGAIITSDLTPTYLPAYLPTYLLTYLPTYLPTYLSNHLPIYITFLTTAYTHSSSVRLLKKAKEELPKSKRNAIYIFKCYLYSGLIYKSSGMDK